MNRFRIAVLISQADSTYQKNLLQGILSQAYTLNMDVAVFATFIKEGSPDSFGEGEMCIFSLPDFNKFDGVIIVPDTIKNKYVVKKLAAKIKESRTPCVTIDYEFEGFECVWNDDIKDIERLVDHLIEVHGCRVIDFFSGVKGHPHSVHREEGYKRSLEKHGIRFEPERIHYGDFWRFESPRVAGEILDSDRPVPQAVACVCDQSAVSLAEELVKRGVKISEDMKIVGYDATAQEINQKSDVTSMVRSSSVGGANGVIRLYEIITGNKPEIEISITQNNIIISKSCGCKEPQTAEEHPCSFSVKPESNSIYDIDPENFYSGYNFMMEDLVRVDNYHDFLWTIDWFRRYIKDIDGMYLCLCDSWNIGSRPEGNGEKLTAYTNTMYLVYESLHDKGKVDLTDSAFDKSELLPGFFTNNDEKPSAYYFSPLHFNEKCFGYNVLRYIDKPVVFNSEYGSWIRYVGCAFEALRRQMKLKLLNERLENMYETLEVFSVTDQLTGVYNRNAYNKRMAELDEISMEEVSDIFILLADLNNLKPINDKYGHIEGDSAIRGAACAVRNACGPDDEAFRIGGDEFVIIGKGGRTKENTDRCIKAIDSYIDNYNLTWDKPYKISLSIGCSHGGIDKCRSIEELVNAADKRMYENKKKAQEILNIKR